MDQTIDEFENHVSDIENLLNNVYYKNLIYIDALFTVIELNFKEVLNLDIIKEELNNIKQFYYDLYQKLITRNNHLIDNYSTICADINNLFIQFTQKEYMITENFYYFFQNDLLNIDIKDTVINEDIIRTKYFIFILNKIKELVFDTYEIDYEFTDYIDLTQDIDTEELNSIENIPIVEDNIEVGNNLYELDSFDRIHYDNILNNELRQLNIDSFRNNKLVLLVDILKNMLLIYYTLEDTYGEIIYGHFQYICKIYPYLKSIQMLSRNLSSELQISPSFKK